MSELTPIKSEYFSNIGLTSFCKNSSQ